MAGLSRAQMFRRMHEEPKEVELSTEKTVLMRRPTMPGLLAKGRLPNTLFVSAGAEEAGLKLDPALQIKNAWELNYRICEAAFVDPPFKRVAEVERDEDGMPKLDEEGNEIIVEDPNFTYPWHYSESEVYAAIAYANEGDEGLRAFHSERRRAMAGSGGEEVRQDS